MTKEETELIIKEQDKSTKEILKVIEEEKCVLLGIIQGKDKENLRLKQENKELKAQLQKKINTTTVSDYPYSALKLEEAKELLKRCFENYIYLEPLRSEIEQFLDEAGK